MVCNACETICPSVFNVAADSAIVRPDASQWFDSQRQQIEDAYDSCCVEVIKIEYADGSRRSAEDIGAISG